MEEFAAPGFPGLMNDGECLEFQRASMKMPEWNLPGVCAVRSLE
jgi:hypothetical protein